MTGFQGDAEAEARGERDRALLAVFSLMTSPCRFNGEGDAEAGIGLSRPVGRSPCLCLRRKDRLPAPIVAPRRALHQERPVAARSPEFSVRLREWPRLVRMRTQAICVRESSIASSSIRQRLVDAVSEGAQPRTSNLVSIGWTSRAEVFAR
jgi:hypothetical protein